MRRRVSLSFPYFLTFLAVLLVALAACAKIHINTIPPPPSTSKLRVCLLPSTGNGNWQVPHEEFAQWVTRVVEQHLRATGMYEVVNRQDVYAVLGDQDVPRWQLERDNWELAKKIGKALHVDYVFSIERSFGKTVAGQDFTIDNVMINIKTGKKFGAWYIVSRPTQLDRDRINSLIREAHRTIFSKAKKDMLATAIQKSKFSTQPKKTTAITPAPQTPVLSPKPNRDEPSPMKKPEQTAATSVQSPTVVKPPDRELSKDADEQKTMTKFPGPAKSAKLAVFDFDTTESSRTVALILSEALREELYLLKQFVLVNRENLQQVLQETALQQTGLIDDKQAVKTGKGLAASQVVTGRLGLLGKTYVLQAKRIDVETFATLGLASTQFKEGQEDDILSQMPDLAKKLSGLK
jgi:curli biogenesis system outer membrane secretion channel CsgG